MTTRNESDPHDMMKQNKVNQSSFKTSYDRPRVDLNDPFFNQTVSDQQMPSAGKVQIDAKGAAQIEVSVLGTTENDGSDGSSASGSGMAEQRVPGRIHVGSLNLNEEQPPKIEEGPFIS